jgi:hypothetical protein
MMFIIDVVNDEDKCRCGTGAPRRYSLWHKS